MNQVQFPQITPKKILLAVGGILLFVITFVVLSNMFSSSSRTLSIGSFSAPMMMLSDGAYADNYETKGIGVSESYAMRTNDSPQASPTSYMPSPMPPAPPSGEAKIVKNGDLSLLVESVDDASQKINALRATLFGQPGNASFSEYGNGGKQGDITIWVPSDKFDSAMTSIKALALRVNNERVSVQDVSSQYIDLESRLRNLKAAEIQYQEIMKRSGKISEVLEVTRVLNDTRSQIEQTQGQLDYLSRQVALSSIHVNLTQEAVPGSVVTDEWRPLSVVKTALKQMLSDLTNFINLLIVFVIGIPVLLLNIGLWVLIAWMLWKVARFVYRKMTATTPTVPPKNVV